MLDGRDPRTHCIRGPTENNSILGSGKWTRKGCLGTAVDHSRKAAAACKQRIFHIHHVEPECRVEIANLRGIELR